MTRLLIPGLLTALVAAGSANAADKCCPPVTYVCQPVTCYKTCLQRVPCERTVCRPVCKEVLVREKCTVMVPKVYEEPRTITCMKAVPRVVEQNVTRCRQVPCTVTDSCGRQVQTFRTETYVERVPVTVMDYQPEKKDVIVKVVRYEPEVRDVVRKQIVREMQPVTVTRNRLAFVQVPYTTTVRVPVYGQVATTASPATTMPLANP